MLGVWVKWLTDHMWYCYINKNHIPSDSPLVDAVMLHHTVSYDLTLRHIDIYGKVNDQGVYCHFFIRNNTSTLHCFEVWKKGEAMNYHKVDKGCLWYKRLYNPFTQKLDLEEQFESSDDKIHTKDDSTKNTNIKEGGNIGNGKVANTDK